MERDSQPSSDRLHYLGTASDSVLSRVLGSLSPHVPPSGLARSLRRMAERERESALARRRFWRALEMGRDRLLLAANDVMRPLALPAAGGILSAVVLIGMWLVPTYPVHADNGADVPTMLTTEPAVKEVGPVAVAGGDLVLDVTVDDQGRMVDYSIVSAPTTIIDAGFRQRLENLLLFTQFVPATAFGQPGFGKLRLTLYSSAIEVKG